LTLKGGTALRKHRLGHRSRFSFDLDFDTEEGASELVAEELDGVRFPHFEFTVHERRGHYTAHVASDLVPASQPLRAKIDFSTRGLWLPPEPLRLMPTPVHAAYPFDTGFVVPAMRVDENVAEKLGRWQREPLIRDLYDLAALSTRIEMFNCEEGHPNVVEPGKRPRTTLVNYIISKDGQPVMTVGCPGGDNQAQANVQLMLNVILFGMDPQQAVEAPRFSTQSNVNSFYPHVYHPGRLDLEQAIPETTAEQLRAMGHRIARAVDCGMGATVSVRDSETGYLSTGADPRRACYAIAL